MNLPPFWFVFDVEAVGFLGDAYAVGWVVIDQEGVEHAVGGLALSDRKSLRGNAAGHEFMGAHGSAVATDHVLATRGCPADLRCDFATAWREWRQQGAVMAADVPWPVEAAFLLRMAEGEGGPEALPYPIIDVASVRLAAGLNPIGTEPRIADELPAHNPIMDARQSARLLIEALAACRAKSLP